MKHHQKSAVFWLLIAVLLLLCACQPTPEQDAVKQKDTNVLIDTVKAEQQEQQNSGDTLPPVKQQFPERYACDFYTSSQNVHVVADVSLEILTEKNSFPMLRVEPRALTDAERLTIAQRLLGSEHLYIYEYRMTREILEDLIREYMRELTPEEQKSWMHSTGSSEAELAEMLERRKQIAADYQRQYNELPEDGSVPNLMEWFGTTPDYSEDNENRRSFISIVRNATDTTDMKYLDYVIIWTDESDRPIEFISAMGDISSSTNVWGFGAFHTPGTGVIDRKDYDKPHEGATVTPNEAIRMVLSYFEDISDFAVSDVEWANNAETDGEVIGLNGSIRWAYLIHFSTRFHGAYKPFCTTPVYDDPTNGQAYIRTWDYESLMAAVDGDGNLTSLVWRAPLKVTDVIAESTTLLSYEEIQKIFEQQINRMLAYDEANGATLTLDSVQLGLFRIREKNDLEHGLLVPAWFFTGHQQNAEAHRGEYGDGFVYDNLNPLLIINAIDGSIIDPQKGY